MNDSTNVVDLSNARERSDLGAGPYATAVGKGGFDSRVSSQWFNRPADQNYLDLNSLYNATLEWAGGAVVDIVDSRDIEVRAPTDQPEDLTLMLPTRNEKVDREANPTHWSFGQLASLVKAPASYMRRLPASIAGINLQYGLQATRSETLQAYVGTSGDYELRAATGPDYGRIYDHEVVAAVQKIAGNGIGDTRWKVPGVLDWRSGTYNPNAPITRDSTTLFASDRDVYMFLVDDRNPIEIGLLPSGQPDLIFRGFIVSNSEVGARALNIATFYLRGVCQNRCLWGVEGFQEISMRHSKYAPQRFMEEARPALETYANSRTAAVVEGVKTAREAIVAKNDDESQVFLQRQGFSKPESRAIVEKVLEEEGKPARSIWDMVQGITAHARQKGHQDERIALEKKAGRMLDKVAKAA